MTPTIGTRLREARLKKKMTQGELAKLLGLSSHATICDIEVGRRGKRPNIELLIKAAGILGVSINWLFLGKEDNKSK